MLSPLSPLRQAKVNLSDYPFYRDVKTRLSMSCLSVDEVKVLREIIHHSLTISIKQLAEDVELSLDSLLIILEKLEEMKLFRRQNMTLIVDKEIRKYFEAKIEKFDENFQPDLDFLQSVLNKVPIHVLPLWYAIPRSSDNIFASIIEKYFLTPTIYRQYLNEIQFDHPIFKALIDEVYASPYFKIPVTSLMAKFDLTHECLEEYLLVLEYHFVCCLSYQRIDNEWQEVVTPFSEWLDYLKFEVQKKAQVIEGIIEKNEKTEFQFIKNLSLILEGCQSKRILIKDIKNLPAYTSQQLHMLLFKLIQLQFVEQYASGHIVGTPKGKEWTLKPLFEQVAALANDPLNTVSHVAKFSHLWNFRNLHMIEKSLRRLGPNQWVDFNQFLEGFISPIGNHEPVSLKNKGKKWKYVFPSYTVQEKQFIQSVIMERLAELGVTATGLFQEQPCFCVTYFGSQFIN